MMEEEEKEEEEEEEKEEVRVVEGVGAMQGQRAVLMSLRRQLSK